MSKFKPITEPDPVHLQIANSIRKAIVRGELKVGDRLPLEKIAAEFGVSRMPVREALIRLEKEGLLVFHHRRGAQVADLTREQFHEITDLRIMLESDALKRSIEAADQADFDEAEAILRQAAEAQDIDELADLHWRFHRKLYEPCNRSIQLEVISSLYANVDRFLRQEWRQVGLRDNWIDSHFEILNAARAGDVGTAVDLTRRHSRDAEKRLAVLIEGGMSESAK